MCEKSPGSPYRVWAASIPSWATIGNELERQSCCGRLRQCIRRLKESERFSHHWIGIRRDECACAYRVVSFLGLPGEMRDAGCSWFECGWLIRHCLQKEED
jgi:hypothetical protein